MMLGHGTVRAVVTEQGAFRRLCARDKLLSARPTQVLVITNANSQLMEWFLILSAFVVGEISGMWLAAMMTPARQRDEAVEPVHARAAMLRQSWKAHARPVLVRLKSSR
jgi:hypothetical protein